MNNTPRKTWQPIDEILIRHKSEDEAEWDDVFGFEPLVQSWPPQVILRRARMQ